MDFLARDGEGQRLRFILAGNRQRHLGARFAAHALDVVVEADAFHGLAVEAGDQVAGLDAGAVGGRILDGRDDLDVAVFAEANFNAQADELAFGAFAQFGVGFLVQVGGMGVERGDHAGNGVFQQFLVFHGFDVIGLDQAKHIGQLAQLFQRQGRLDGFLRHGGKLQRHGDAGHHAQADQAGIFEFAHHCTFAASVSCTSASPRGAALC